MLARSIPVKSPMSSGLRLEISLTWKGYGHAVAVSNALGRVLLMTRQGKGNLVGSASLL